MKKCISSKKNYIVKEVQKENRPIRLLMEMDLISPEKKGPHSIDSV